MICSCSSFPLSVGQLLPISAVFICPTWTLHPSSTPVRGSRPAHLSHDGPPRSGPGAFISHLHPSITPSIYTSYCSIRRRIYYQLSVSRPRCRSFCSSPALWALTLHPHSRATPQLFHRAPSLAPAPLSDNSRKLRHGGVNESLNLTPLL